MKILSDKQLLCLVKTDIEAFNDYRKKNYDQKIEFTKLEGVNFKNCDLDYANFSNMNLEGLEFTDSNMKNVKLKETNISNCNFTRCYLNNSDFRCVKAKNTCFKSARASACDFRGANVELANFSMCRLHYSDFRNSNFTKLQREQCFHSQKIVTGKEWRIDDWYEEFYYVSTLILDKDKKDGEREKKLYRIRIYMTFVFAFSAMFFIYSILLDPFSWKVLYSLVLALLSGGLCLCTELSIIEDLKLTHYLDDLKI